MKRGDFVTLTLEETGAQIRAMIVLATDNGKSLLVMFAGTLGNYRNVMPLLRDEAGDYRDVADGNLVKVTDQ